MSVPAKIRDACCGVNHESVDGNIGESGDAAAVDAGKHGRGIKIGYLPDV